MYFFHYFNLDLLLSVYFILLRFVRVIFKFNLNSIKKIMASSDINETEFESKTLKFDNANDLDFENVLIFFLLLV